MLVYDLVSKHITSEKIRKPKEHEVVWIRLRNPDPNEVKHVLSDLLKCHPLVVEDDIKLNQRPKIEQYPFRKMPPVCRITFLCVFTFRVLNIKLYLF